MEIVDIEDTTDKRQTDFFFFSARVQKQCELNTFEKEFKTTYSNIIHIFILGESDISNVQSTIKLFVTPPYAYILSNNTQESFL